MFPIIFQYKMLTIGGYGIMLGLAFYLGFLLTERELKLAGKDPELAYKMILVIVPAAIIGAKIFHIIDYFDEFLRNPFDMVFSGSGLSVLGGFVVAFIACVFVIKRNNESIPQVFDLTSPGMALSYGIGRLGCHVAGDPCYGIPTATMWGTPYPNGLSPVSIEVFPTPLFESFFSFMVFLVIMQLRKKPLPIGMIFSIYLIFQGFARLMVEFLRTNPKILFQLTQAQIIGIIFMITGTVFIGLIKKKNSSVRSA